MNYIFLANGFEEIEAIATIDTLRRAKIALTTVSISNTLQVEGAHNVTIIADKLFTDINFSDANMLILPGGMPGTNHLADHAPLNDLLTIHNNSHKWIAAICAAPLVLGRLGILEGKDAVCYPSFEPELRGANVLMDSVVVSDNIITSRGPGCTIDFASTIISILSPDTDIQSLRAAMLVD